MSNYVDEGGVTKIARKIKQEYVAKEAGKGLTSNDFTDALKEKLENLTSIFRFKGIVATTNDLPTTAEDGDIYGVGTAQTGFTGYIWFTNQWHEWESITPNEVSYDLLQNKPSVEGVELEGNKTASDLGLVSQSTFTTAINNKLDAPLNSGTAGTVLINNNDGTYEWGTIGGAMSAGNQTINGVVTVNVTSDQGIACWILNRNNTIAGFIEGKYSNTRAFVIGKGSSASNKVYLQTYNNYSLDLISATDMNIEATNNINVIGTIVSSGQVTSTVAPTTNNSFIRKTDIKDKVSQAASWDDFKSIMEAW